MIHIIILFLKANEIGVYNLIYSSFVFSVVVTLPVSGQFFHSWGIKKSYSLMYKERERERDQIYSISVY